MGVFGPVTMKTLALDLQRDVGNIELFMQQLRHLSEDLLFGARHRIRHQMAAQHVLATGERPDMQVVYVLHAGHATHGLLHAVDIDAVVARRTTTGGTAPERVAEQITAAREALGRDDTWLTQCGSVEE